MRYELIDSRYVLQDEGCSHPPLLEIAIGYMSPKDIAQLPWRSQRHGDPEIVNAWAEKARQVLSKAGPVGKTVAAEIHVISGPLDLHDLNAVLQDPSSILALVNNAARRSEKIADKQIKVDGIPIDKRHTNE